MKMRASSSTRAMASEELTTRFTRTRWIAQILLQLAAGRLRVASWCDQFAMFIDMCIRTVDTSGAGSQAKLAAFLTSMTKSALSVLASMFGEIIFTEGSRRTTGASAKREDDDDDAKEGSASRCGE
eukprot:CAMPEP_0177667832 /NCGR_PEP_ID=MMETSP0447-20121125/22356_1 /TAXON_ID=0 /ORGANISM="Stygamoeba regulata, Strain BSH-02190019" /LENGTH=125 /DNA_ID=CAMNT_0019174135 /DNA_START=334 /DNA_END=712 /DNA_ORIENTATION=-